MFYDEIFAFTILPSCFASHLPLHKGGSLPPDSSPERCNTLYLAGKAFEKEYEQSSVLLLLFSVGKTCFMEGTPCKLFFVRIRGSPYQMHSPHSAMKKEPTEIGRLLFLCAVRIICTCAFWLLQTSSCALRSASHSALSCEAR